MPLAVGSLPTRRQQPTHVVDSDSFTLTRTTYRDDRVRTGTRYAYRLTAVDRYGNESAPSEPVSDTASP